MRALILSWFLHSTKFIHSTKMCHSPCSFQFWNSFCLEIIIYQAVTFKPLWQISLRFTKLLFLLAQDQNLLALGNRVISFPAFVGGMFKSGHFNTPPNTRPVLCRIAPCECFGDAIAAFLGHYKVGQETGSKFAPKNSPTVQFDTTLTQSYAQPQNSPVQELK